MVSSLDGFIAKKDDDISWMHSKDYYKKGKILGDDEIAEFLERIDCYLMGFKTYQRALELGWVYGDTPVKVVTNRDLSAARTTVNFHSGDLSEPVRQLKADYKNIWLVGGAMLAQAFIEQQLADEIVISIIPVLLGEGIPFFGNLCQERDLHLKDVMAFQDGMVELSYQIIKK